MECLRKVSTTKLFDNSDVPISAYVSSWDDQGATHWPWYNLIDNIDFLHHELMDSETSKVQRRGPMSGVDSEDGSLDSKHRLYQLSRYRVEPKEKTRCRFRSGTSGVAALVWKAVYCRDTQ
ncbi:predicted protein [Lichtheimia corymbifera JMRC:FSU:9682]|uniref:Uncharacterized protein n=1 Tax=Lichtheimia corymbifera JMRC:FSU:9682 TaxID=1263082 RepID=A0A068SAJ4_9FUNG|nr:predicted protein [Lichtheimia corymbifera JMRC:FSU:9682]